METVCYNIHIYILVVTLREKKILLIKLELLPTIILFNSYY